jgi:methylthioribose-1-phosphate isomerase
MDMAFRTIEWKRNRVFMIDQRRLPQQELYVELKDHHAVAEAIKDMVIRGAPAIGVATAMGIALGARIIDEGSYTPFIEKMEAIFNLFLKTRPTAVNLRWAVERMRRVLQENKGSEVFKLKGLLEEEAFKIYAEDLETNRQLGENGKGLITNGATVLTHCNAGALATAGYGTALGVIRSAFLEGKNVHVVAGETRPFLQGTRLTAWELQKEGIPVTLITDNMVGHFMKNEKVDLVVVGADRIAANGDVANKIGTYTIGILANEHGIPFYVAAPLSTFDVEISSGEMIPIEQRLPEEITHWKGERIAPEGILIFNPAFDITPNRLISGIITEKGIIRPPYQKNIMKFKTPS